MNRKTLRYFVFSSLALFLVTGYLMKKDTVKSLLEDTYEEGNFGASEKLIRKGNEAPDFTLEDIGGNEVNLYRELEKGPVVLDFWASWCAPCRRAMPGLAEAVESANEPRRAKGRPVIQVLSINGGEAKKRVASFATSRQGYGFTWLLDQGNKINKLYGVQAIPTIILINQDKKVHHVQVGALGKEFLRPYLDKL